MSCRYDVHAVLGHALGLQVGAIRAWRHKQTLERVALVAAEAIVLVVVAAVVVISWYKRSSIAPISLETKSEVRHDIRVVQSQSRQIFLLSTYGMIPQGAIVDWHGYKSI